MTLSLTWRAKFICVLFSPIASLFSANQAHAGTPAAVALSTRALLRPIAEFEKAYTDNGFEAPALLNTSFTGRFLVRTAEDWRFGVGGGSIFSNQKKSGTKEIRFSGAYGGLITDYFIDKISSHDVIFSTLLGWGTAQIAYENSATTGSRVEQDFAVIEPKISFEFKFHTNVRGAIYAGYMLCLPLVKKTTGSLNAETPVANAFSLGVEFLFGIFE